MKNFFSRNVIICGFAGFSMMVAACGDSSNDFPSPLGPDVGEVSSSSGVVGTGDVFGLSSSAVDPGSQGGVPGGSVSGNSGGSAGSSSPVQQMSSAAVEASSSSSNVAQIGSSNSQGNQDITHFQGGSVVGFSEVSPLNANLKDNDGGDPGWVELYNTSDAPFDLKGLALTDDLSKPRRWIFGDAKIPAKSHMVVFLSGKNFADYIPPSDSVSMIGTNCSVESGNGGMGGFGGGMGGLGGGMGGANSGEAVANLPGQSGICFTEAGQNKFGSVMRVMQNFMGAASSSFTVNVAGNANLSKANQLVLKGYIDKGHKIRVNFNFGGTANSWSGKNLKGTGDSSTVYYVTLPENAGLNFSNVSGTIFSLETEGSETTTIKMNSYVARNRGHEPHASFKANKDGGALYLVNADNGILDSVHYNAVPTGASWSRDGAGKWGLAAPSPYGNTVGEVFALQVQLPEVSVPPSGFYTSAVSVTLPAGTRCEQGGAEPTTNSPVVQQTLNIGATTVLRCRTYAEGSYPSEEITRTYVFEKQPSLASIFVTTDPLSMFSPDSGLYMKGNGASAMEPNKGANFWSNRELPVYVELFEPGKPQEHAFGVVGDYKISGQYSRAKEKKSFSITLREKYGDKRLKYPLFPDYPELKKFKAFTLRNFGNNCGSDYVRDRIGTSMTEGLGVDYQRGRYVVVYYNGRYYGLHDLRERNNEYYYETKYGLDANDIDLLDAQNNASAGSSADYQAMIDWLQSNELTNEANYKKIAEQIDIDNYMNYMQAEMFLNNGDWPHNNLKKWRVASEKGKWKWFLYDTDFGFGVSYNTQNGNVFNYVTNAGGTNGMGMGFGGMGGQQAGGSISQHTILMIRLLANETFKNAFINRFCVLLDMNFSAERLVKRIDELQSQVESEMARDVEFWGYDATSMSNNLEEVRNFAQTRQAAIRSDMEAYFKLGSTAEMTLAAQGSGVVLVNGLPLDQPSMKLTFYRDVPVTVSVQAKSGVFTGWSDGVTDLTRTVNPGEVTSLTAVFK